MYGLADKHLYLQKHQTLVIIKRITTKINADHRRTQMKYALIYYKNTTNIGDDILTYAAKQFLPQVDYYIDREETDLFLPETKEYTAAILNGWYLHYSYAFPPSPYIIPLFIGTHFNSDQMIFGDYSYLDQNVTDYLRQIEGGIGCRDKQTMDVLGQKGIENYFSGCLTLTLKPFSDIQGNGSIVLTDVSDEIKNYITKRLPDKQIICKTHRLSDQEIGTDWAHRETRVEDYLKCYQKASLVITSRLHCALPSIALGAPVILIGKYDADYYDRFESYAQYCSCFSEEDLLAGKADAVIHNPPKNADIRTLTEQMTKNCRQFIDSFTDREMDTSALPELSQYKELYIERTGHMRRAIHKLLDIRYALEIQHQQDVETMEHVLNVARQALNS